LRYSKLANVFVQRSDLVSQLTLVYSDSDNETAVVKARMTFDTPLIEWDVNLETIPVNDTGKELVVIFESFVIGNTGYFFADQNGLEMQQRYLNERIGYWLPSDSRFDNVSQNFYPVT